VADHGHHAAGLGAGDARRGERRHSAPPARVVGLASHDRGLSRPYFLALLAEAYGTMGRPEDGLAALAEAQRVADDTGECWYEAERYRLQGELLLAQSREHQREAEACYGHALDVARGQQAKSFELRTATSLARLWQHQGKPAEARQLLGAIYGWFTEGFDTADLQEAKALLEELGG
jgi:predicted ATPase